MLIFSLTDSHHLKFELKYRNLQYEKYELEGMGKALCQLSLIDPQYYRTVLGNA